MMFRLPFVPLRGRSPQRHPVLVGALLVVLLGSMAGVAAAVAADSASTEKEGKEAKAPVDPLAFLEPFLGDWAPHPSWSELKTKPIMRTLVPLSMHRSPNGQVIRVREGMPRNGLLATEGVIVWDAKAQKALFLANQGDDRLLFRGHYELVKEGVLRRVYEVVHMNGIVQPWQETFTLIEPDVIDWKTEIWKDEKYQPWGSPDFQAVRVQGSAPRIAEDTVLAGEKVVVAKDLLNVDDPLAIFEPFVGTWRADPSQFPEEAVRQSRAAGIEDRRQRLEWGTHKKWLRYEELELRNGEWIVEGSAMIGWDAVRGALLYTEYAVSGNTLHGVFVPMDGGKLRRYYTVSYPSGETRQWRGTWTPGKDGKTLHVQTEGFKDDSWKPWIPGFVLDRVE